VLALDEIAHQLDISQKIDYPNGENPKRAKNQGLKR
jgi:hypothetical protein